MSLVQLLEEVQADAAGRSGGPTSRKLEAHMAARRHLASPIREATPFEQRPPRGAFLDFVARAEADYRLDQWAGFA